MTKVLHFYKTYLPETIGGTEQVINQIVRGVAKFGVDSEVLTLTSEPDQETLEVDGHSVHRCQSNFEIASTPFSVSAFKQFRRLAEKADLIHFHFPYPFADILHFISRVKKPSIVSYHSDIVKQKHLLKIYKPLMHRFLSNVDHIVAASPNYLQSSDTLNHFDHKTSVIPYGLDKKSYLPATFEKLNYWRNKFGLRFFLFIGVVRYYKGLHILVEAAKNAKYPIVILGSGPLEAELKQQVIQLGISNIHFLGFLQEEDKTALLELCYAIVFPSHLRSEAFGISLLEGAMYGKPLISCEIGTGTSYINVHQKTGLSILPGNAPALLQAMDYLWGNPVEAELMGQASSARYYELFTADKMSQSYLALYNQLTNDEVVKPLAISKEFS